MPVQILSTNAGGKLASEDDQAAFMSSVEKDHPGWQIIYIAEVDARLASFDTSALKFGGRYLYRRHWPGPGSFAMAVVIRSSLAPFVRDVTPLGRCIRIQVSVGDRAADSALHVPSKNKFCGIFTHGSNASLQDTFAESASLLNTRMRLAETVSAGDFNVDILPDFASDPYVDSPNRGERQADRRQLLRNFCRLYGFKVPDVKCILSAPGGPFSDLASRFPISRLLVGNQLGCAARLDFALSKNPKELSLTHSWIGYLADHCINIVDMHDTFSYL